MNQNANRIDVRSAEGRLMFSLHLYDEETFSSGNTAGSAGYASHSDQKNRNGNGAKDSTAMTDAQKRYLFRILAERGFEGDHALRRLKERFGVEALADVSKREASTMIEQLLEEAEAK